MIFKGEKLQNFLSMKHRQAIFSKMVKYEELKLQCSICPNGWNQFDKGKVMFYLEKGIIPSNVKIIAFIIKIYCPQTNTKYQKVCESKISSGKGFVLNGWYDTLLLLSECRDKDELEFICNVDILKIKYQDYTQYIQTGIKINKSSKINWDINEDESDLIQSNRAVIGPCSDDECWMIGQGNTRQYYSITLNKWPQNIGKMDVKCKVTANYESSESKVKEKEHKVVCDNFRNVLWYEDIPGVPSSIIVEFDIINVYDMNNLKMSLFDI